ncbi:hypothetical protein LLG95_05305 [bacterium]|nr:hypothetical protein [bacterium]
MNWFLKWSAAIVVAVVSVIFSAPSKAATLDTARQYYDDKDYKSAASEYGALLTFNWPKTKLGLLYDAYTECLVITGNYELAERKIDDFVKILPGDSLEAKFAARKVRIAHDRGDSALAEKLSADFITKYTVQNPYYPEVQRYAGDTTVSLGSPTAVLEAARQSYQLKDYKNAATQYGALLEQKSSPMDLAALYDAVTECTMIVGQYELANEKIAAYFDNPTSASISEKLVIRKALMAHHASNFTSATLIAKDYLAKYDKFTSCGLQAQRLLVDSLGRNGQNQEKVDFIEQTLVANPKHPLYAELRRAQADTLARIFKQDEAARLKYADAMEHSPSDSEIYETSAYRISEILLAQAKSTAKTDAQKSNELTSQSLQYLSKFVEHPGADKNHPDNVLRRITALKRLKRFEDMEREAAQYLSDDNVVNYNTIVALKSILGEYSDFQNVFGAAIKSEDLLAVREIKNAYYADNYADATRLAKEYLAVHANDSDSRRLVQRLLIGTHAKRRATKELVSFVDQALSDNPNHPMYADFRRAQADALWDMKQTSNSRTMFIDAMAHASNDSDVYEWCCYRAGAAAMAESDRPGIDVNTRADLRLSGRKYLQMYVDLPSKDRIYPSNVVRRMMAYNWLKQNDQMELEANRYLAERSDFNSATYVHIMRMLSYNRSMRQNGDQAGALAAFEQLRLHENELGNSATKVSVGISMLKSATKFSGSGVAKDEIVKLRETGRKYLQEAAKDESLKVSRRMDAYYFLQDWAAVKNLATATLEKTNTDDSSTRAEMLNWIGVALGQQQPQDLEGAVASFDKVLLEYDKNPQLVKERAALAAYWALWLRMSQKDETKARVYLNKITSMPDCDMKTKAMTDFKDLLTK